MDLIDCWLLNECRSERQGKALKKKKKKGGGGEICNGEGFFFCLFLPWKHRSYYVPLREHVMGETDKQTDQKKKGKKNQNKTAAWGAPVRVQNHPEQLSKRGAQVGPQKCLFLQQREGGEQEDVQPAANRGRKESTRQRLPPLRKMREGSPNTPQSARGPTDILPLGTSSPLSHTPSSQKIKNK